MKHTVLGDRKVFSQHAFETGKLWFTSGLCTDRPGKKKKEKQRNQPQHRGQQAQKKVCWNTFSMDISFAVVQLGKSINCLQLIGARDLGRS